MVFSLVSFVLLAFSGGSLEWQGFARWEWDSVNWVNGDGTGAKNYGLAALSLQPRWVLNDQSWAQARMELLPPLLPNQTTGYLWGRGLGPYQTQASAVTPAVVWAFGQWEAQTGKGFVRIGRQPLGFGLGAYWNPGVHPEDLFTTVQDGVLVGFAVGRLLWRLGGFSHHKDGPQWGGGWDWWIAADYDHEDSQSQFGVLWRQMLLNQDQVSQDRSWQSAYQSVNAISGARIQTTHVYYRKGFGTLGFEAEAGFESGPVGLADGSGNPIRVGGFGLLAQLWQRESLTASWNWVQSVDYLWRLQVGVASGDDPNTATYEAFQWHRNVMASYLGRHPVGVQDLWQSRRVRSRSLQPPFALAAPTGLIQEEALSNVIWIQFSYRWRLARHLILRPLIQLNHLYQPSVPGSGEFNLTAEYQTDPSWRLWVTGGVQQFSTQAAQVFGARSLPTQLGWQAGVSYRF